MFLKYPLIFLHASLFTLFYTGCSSSHLYSSKADITQLNTKIDTLEQSLDKLQKQCSESDQKQLSAFATLYDDSFASMHQELQKIQREQNATLALLQQHSKEPKPEKIIIYRDKKETKKFQNKLVLGQEEDARIEPPHLVLRARIDTGANTSSIDARDIEEFERDGEKWVRFTLIDRKTNTKHPIETKIARYAKIVQSSLPDTQFNRIVVKLKLTLGDFSDLSEFTLTDREHMDFPLLIGRNVLKDIAIVDVSAKELAPLPKTKE